MKGGDAPIVLFAYAFPHRKTQDFILELAAFGLSDVLVIAAPWKDLGRPETATYFPTALNYAPPRAAAELCAAFGFYYVECAHDDAVRLSQLCAATRYQRAIIAGARILKREVIALFPEGIVNFHPGKLPETAGLDAFFYAIEKSIPTGVTAHIIDDRIDAGDRIFFLETAISLSDSPESVLHNNYQDQIVSLRRYLSLSKEQLVLEAIDRPSRNQPMPRERKAVAIEGFSRWRDGQARRQAGEKLIKACSLGARAAVADILSDFPELIEFRSLEGWTPLVVAAHREHTAIVRHLLDLGADANARGERNGTTVLMYAKTPLLHRPDRDFAVLDALLSAGADIDARDRFGRTVFDYVLEAGDTELCAWLEKRRAGK